MLKLMEECTGVGELLRHGDVIRRGVRYRVSRYQGVLPSSGLPVPGLHRLEGALEMDPAETEPDLAGATLTLRLEDGRALGITLLADGRILSEGHGPFGCSCC